MKLLLILGLLSLTACSSLITRTDLKNCQSQCADKGSCMMHVSKQEGQLMCECAPTKEEQAIVDKEIKEVSEELDKSSDETKPVEIQSSEQELIPAVPEKIEAVEEKIVAPIDSKVDEKQEEIKQEEKQTVEKNESLEIKKEEVKPLEIHLIDSEKMIIQPIQPIKIERKVESEK